MWKKQALYRITDDGVDAETFFARSFWNKVNFTFASFENLSAYIPHALATCTTSAASSSLPLAFFKSSGKKKTNTNRYVYTLNSEPKALTGDKSEGIKSRGAAEGIKSRGAAEAFIRGFSPVKAEGEEFNVLINILQAEAEKLSGFTPSIIQPEAAGRGLYARCKTR